MTTTDVARDLTAIADLAERLLTQAVHHAQHRLMPHAVGAPVSGQSHTGVTTSVRFDRPADRHTRHTCVNPCRNRWEEA